MKIRFGLQLKFILIFLVFGFCIAYGIYREMEDISSVMIQEQAYQNAISIAKLTASVLEPDKIEEYAITLEPDEAYWEMKERIDNIKLQTDTYYLYVMYPYNEQEGVYIFDAKLTKEQIRQIGDSEEELGSPVDLSENFDRAKEVLRTKKPCTQAQTTSTMQGNEYQTLASVYVPILNSDNEAVAFVGVDVLVSDMIQSLESISREMLQTIAVLSAGCIFVIFIIMNLSVIRPLKTLAKHAEEMENNIFGNMMDVSGHDEISEIKRVFNRVNVGIGRHLKEIEEINNAYYKYLPSELFTLLNRDMVTRVQLGDNTKQELAMMSYGILNFDELSRQMDTEQMFNFMNEICAQTIPAVMEQGGIIENFREASFTAFYRTVSENLLQSAITASNHVRRRLGQNGQEIQLGFGLAYGRVMIGAVGHESRRAIVSIARKTNMADFLQKMCEKYGAAILVTSTLAEHIPDFEVNYHSRTLGFVYDTFQQRLEKIYEVYDGDDEQSKRDKNRTKELFERGVRLFCAQKFGEARAQFVAVLKQSVHDAAAREYLYLCNSYYQSDSLDETEIFIEKYE